MFLRKTNDIYLDIADIKLDYKKSNSLFGIDGFNVEKKKNKSILFSKGKSITSFFTEDSKLYITQKEMNLMASGLKLDRETKKWDSLSSRIIKEYKLHSQSRSGFLIKALKEKQNKFENGITEASATITEHFSIARMWNLSIIGAILFGMFSMTMIYKYLGQGVSADENSKGLGYSNERQVSNVNASMILGEQVDNNIVSGDDSASYTRQVIEDLKVNKEKNLEKELTEMVKGYPIEAMIPYIAKQDRIVAAFIIGIAKKESNWGKRVPVLDGQDCYNYWGYRGQRKLMGTGGHTCFNSRKDAVDTVAKRIKELIAQNLDTPSDMVVWKCGSSCAATGGEAAAKKWISDVNKYFQQINE